MISREDLIRNEYYWIETIQNKLFNDLSEYLDSSNISQNEIAKRMGVSKGRVSQLLNGNNMNYKLETIVRLCLAIDKIPSFDLIDIADVLTKKEDTIHSESKMIFKWYNQEFIKSDSTKSPMSKVINMTSNYTTEKIKKTELACCNN